MNDCWKTCKIGDIAKVISGYAFRSSEFHKDATGIPVIKIKNIRNGNVDLSEIQYVDKSYLSLDSKYHITGGDLLVSLTGSHITQPGSVVGRIARFEFDNRSCLLNQRTGKIIVTNPDECDRRFLFYVLSETHIARTIALKAHGAANQANVSPNQVESVKIPFPPLQTQRKISAILSAFDDLIENNLHQLNILEEISRLLYHEWFVSYRFPGNKKVKMKDTNRVDLRSDFS